MTPGTEWLGHLIHQHGMWAGLMAAFVGGMALNLTPCVYPMLPVTLAFFSGQARGSIRRSLILGACYVLGISASYAVLGLLAAQTGALLGSWLQQGWVLLLVGAVIVALALSMFGLYELRPPQAVLQRLGTTSSGAWGAAVMGLVIGIVAAPCIGPFILGLLLVVGELGDPLAGLALFFALGLGMGLPYMALGVAANRFGTLPRAGAWLVWVKHALGVALLGVALMIARPALGPRLTLWAVIALLLGAGLYLGWMAQIHSTSRRFRWIRHGVGASLLVVAALIGWPRPIAAPGVAWTPYSEAAWSEAVAAGRPIIVDVYADWCLPCVELDHTTFRNPEVVQALAHATTLRIDVTRQTPKHQELFLKRHRIIGVPTVLLFDAGGEERRDLRLSGFETPSEFLARLSRATAGSP